MLPALLFIGCSGEPPAPSELEGVWLCTEPEEVVGWLVNFERDRFFVIAPEMAGSLGGRMRLRSVEQRSQLDLHIDECDCPVEGKVARLIYALRGDDLLVAASEPGDKRRPSSFSPAEGVRVVKLIRRQAMAEPGR